MEGIINLQIEKLPGGFYLAASDDILGLVVHGRTINKTIEIARDIAKKLIEEQEDKIERLKIVTDSFTYPLVPGV